MYHRLENSIIDVIKEEQAKLGYRKEEIRLYYPLSSLDHFFETEADAEEILAFYANYIEQTAITFEYVVPSIEEFRGRIRHTLERFPYLIAEKDGKIAGYAYVSPFKERAAYDWSVETSIYEDMEQKRSGIGRRRYEELEII